VPPCPARDYRAGHAAAPTARTPRPRGRRPAGRAARRADRPVRLEPQFHRISGDFPDPYGISAEQVASDLNAELTHPASELLLAREIRTGALAGLAVTLAEHPDPIDPYPWIGLLMVHGKLHRGGYGKELAARVEERLRTAGHVGARLAVLEDNPGALLFWTALGYRAIYRREDRRQGRPCLVLHKVLTDLTIDP
jgi:GNAT superfamily N-acetyltransferase